MNRFQRFEDFAKILFSPFFRWWWAAITGLCSLFAFVATPNAGLVLAPWVVGGLLLVLFSLVFLVVTTVYIGWRIFNLQFATPTCTDIRKHEQYEQGIAVMLECACPVQNGTLLELRRDVDGAECLAAVLEVVETNVRGQIQAQSVWFAPGHLRDIRLKKVQFNDLTVSSCLSRRTLMQLQTDSTGEAMS